MSYGDPQQRNRGVASAIQVSLRAKLERLLRRPVIARVVAPNAQAYEDDEHEDDQDELEEEADIPEIFSFLSAAASPAYPKAPPSRRERLWREDPSDGTVKVSIEIDYDDLWRGAEKEILEAVVGTIENHVTFLTDAQHKLLTRSPREFLDLQPKPESAELLTYRWELIGGSQRVVELTIAAAPQSSDLIRHIAIVPNLIPLERQLAGVHLVEKIGDDSALAPLRALLGLCDVESLPTLGTFGLEPKFDVEQLDPSQEECVRRALTTPHFAVIKGPPGSGKTTVISTIIRQALAQGQRVLVVSPTHVAVDNVVEKLAPKAEANTQDNLELRSLPIRFSAKSGKLSRVASEYWVGPKKERRGATIGRRVERCLRAHVPIASELFERVDENIMGFAPISAAVASCQSVVCGTPIGVLSFPGVRDSAIAEFDLLIVDEVSKMTLPEFLAIAVKARRWVLVGDPDQLPPYNSAEENADALDDLVPPVVELAMSVGAILERLRPATRQGQRLVVVAREPAHAVSVIWAHLDNVEVESGGIATFDDAEDHPIIVCEPDQLDEAIQWASPSRGRDRTHNPDQAGTVFVLVERGVVVARPEFGTGTRLVEARARAQVRIFETGFNVYHAQPWSTRTRHRLRLVESRRGLDKYLPSCDALQVALRSDDTQQVQHIRRRLIEEIALRFAVNAVSVYDWLTGIPAPSFDVPPLRELGPIDLGLSSLREVVRPFVGVLKRQYRMHASLSAVPREHFYFGEALEDGKPSAGSESRVVLQQVSAEGEEGESNEREAQAILDMLQKLDRADVSRIHAPEVLVITPYRKQERRLAELIGEHTQKGTLCRVKVEVCTLDRCQGRESQYVFISLVRNQASPFLDAPKRWNVALTRAIEGLFIFGDVDAYLREGAAAREQSGSRPYSLLARLLGAYQIQNSRARAGGAKGRR